MRILSLALAALVVTACGQKQKPVEPKVVSVAGLWWANVPGAYFEMRLTDSSDAISVSGRANSLRGWLDLRGSGRFDNPWLIATIYPGTYYPFNLTAEYAGDSLAGRLNGSGFVDDTVVFRRMK